MVKKLFFQLQNHDDTPNTHIVDPDPNAKWLLNANDMLHNQLVVFKNKITRHHKSKRWDRYKKLTNDYELVFTTSQGFPSIATHNPISRSYFKLWEILHDLGLCTNKAAMKAAFLADAPGGFVEAFVNYRHTKNDALFAISLKATNRVIPQWKLTSDYCKQNNMTVTYGTKGTGDLYDMQTIDDFINLVGESSCNFITADGGFDFSKDFNAQENMSTRLIMCEVYAALRLQLDSGSLVLKVFDIHESVTIKILYILSVFYETLTFVKPMSSRPANSEKYVVCTGFKMHQRVTHEWLIESLRSNIIHYDRNSGTLSCIQPNTSFLASIIEFNQMYIVSQVLYICKTLEMIDEDIPEHVTCKVVQRQVKKAVKWCHKYKIPVSLHALQKYRPYFAPLSIPGLTNES